MPLNFTNELIEKVNSTDKPFRDNITIHQLFEEKVKASSSQEAVICEYGKSFNGKKFLTYEELNKLSNQIAHKLRAEGVGRDDIVGICTERSFAMIIGILGILKSGGAYLPISPDYPEDRIRYMLENSKTKIVLCQDKTTDRIKFNGKIINLESQEIYNGDIDNPVNINNSRDLAYVIYTSGSTGKPKGVMIEHRSIVNRLNWMQEVYPICSNDVILQKTPFYFDVSVWEIFWWAIEGAKMCFLMPGGEKIPLIISETIKKNNISVIHFVPSMLNVYLEYLESKSSEEIKKLSSIKQVFSSGELLAPSHVKKFNNILGKNTGAGLTNLYGPTESTVDVSFFDCPKDNGFDRVPIGRPIHNTKFYIVKDDNVMGVNEEGELCISGVGLARGYINKQELTKEKFVDNPFLPGKKMYKTGDIARWLPDGNVEFLGREDQQVKIRGLRIELGEIESTIREYKGIHDCIVTVKQYSENIILLIAHIVCKQNFSHDALKEHLKKYLPDYMIPNHFVMLDQIPLLPNGKADRKSLPEPVLKIK